MILKMKYIKILLPFFSLIFSQEVIGEGMTGTNLLDYLRSNYKTSSTLGYNEARDVYHHWVGRR